MDWSLRRRNIVWGGLTCLLLAGLWVALTVGKYPLTWSEVLVALLQRHTVEPFSDHLTSTPVDIVVWQLRVPRMVAGMLVGACLAGAGAAYQSMFRNPLVSPDILGVSAGAGLGAVTGIVLAVPMPLMQLMAFAGGMIAVGIVYVLSTLVRRHDPVLVLVLAGVAVSTFLGAVISLLKIVSDPYTQLASITFWLLGGLNSVGLHDVVRALPFALVGLFPLVLLRWRINLLSLTDDEAMALGLNVRRLRAVLIVAATLMTACVVSFAGIIGWVGLVIPHMARLLVGASFARVLPASLFLGATFLLFTDTLARSASSIELPLGVLTSLVGAPFFLYLLARGRKVT